MKIKDRIKRKFSISRINHSVHKFFILHSKQPNPTSYPYISGDTFRSIANHIFDEISTINPEDVKENDLVFIKTSYINRFFTETHPNIRNSYVLISHNDDGVVDEGYLKYIDEKIIKWYAQNVNVLHPKIIPIPIGLENLCHYNNGIIKKFNRIKRVEIKKSNKILYGFNPGTNPTERYSLLENLQKTKVAEKIQGWPNSEKYLNTLNSYKFVASPPGNGIDCHRTWEAIYANTIPIVKNSILTRFYFDLGLPIMIVNDWQEIINCDEKKLEDTYETLKKRLKNPAIYFEYWLQRIKKHE